MPLPAGIVAAGRVISAKIAEYARGVGQWRAARATRIAAARAAPATTRAQVLGTRAAQGAATVRPLAKKAAAPLGPSTENAIPGTSPVPTTRQTSSGGSLSSRKKGKKARSPNNYRRVPVVQLGPLMMSADIEKDEKWAAMEEHLTAPYNLTMIAGNILVESTRKRFYKQGADVGGWPARKVPSLGGILQDLAKGRNIHRARRRPRPVLVVTGALRDSFEYRETGKFTIEVFSNAPYAMVHQKGGARTVTITPTMKANLNKKRGEIYHKFKWLMKREAVTIQVRRRTILAVTKRDVKDMQKQMESFLNARRRGGKPSGLPGFGGRG